MIIFVASGVRTSSSTLIKRLEDFYKTKSVTLKCGGGVGQLNLRASYLKLLKLKIFNKIGKNIIIDQHLFPIENSLKLLDNWFGLDNIKFVITYRNIYDHVFSFYKRKINKNTFQFLRSNYYPTYMNFNSKKYEINLLDILMLINFYAMWFKVEKEKYIKNLQFISFDENTKDIESVNKKLSTFLNDEIILKEDITSKFEETKQFEISENLKDLIKEYSKSFTDIDFSRIGL